MMNSLISPTASTNCQLNFTKTSSGGIPFFPFFNGWGLFLSDQPTTDVLTGACPIAARAYFWGDWYCHNFHINSLEFADLLINHKEVLALIFAAFHWARFWKNQHFIMYQTM